MDRKLKFLILGSDSVLRNFQRVEAKGLVAPASRRLLAPSLNSDRVGKRPARPLHTAKSDRLNSQPVRQQLESAYSFKLRHSLLLALLCFGLNPNAQMNAQAPAVSRPANPAPSVQSPSTPAAKPGSLEDKIEKYLRNMYAWGPQYEIKLGPAKPSPIPDLLEVPVTVGLNNRIRQSSM